MSAHSDRGNPKESRAWLEVHVLCRNWIAAASMSLTLRFHSACAAFVVAVGRPDRRERALCRVWSCGILASSITTGSWEGSGALAPMAIETNAQHVAHRRCKVCDQGVVAVLPRYTVHACAVRRYRSAAPRCANTTNCVQRHTASFVSQVGTLAMLCKCSVCCIGVDARRVAHHDGDRCPVTSDRKLCAGAPLCRQSLSNCHAQLPLPCRKTSCH